MSSRIFPDNRRNTDELRTAREAIKSVGDYVDYMCDQIDYAYESLLKKMADSGDPSALLEMIRALQGNVATINATITSLTSRVSADEAAMVTEVAFDSTNSKITRTKNGTTSDVVGSASSSSAGLMSSTDKSKLDGIASGATAVGYSQTLSSGTEVGEISINGTSTKLYAPSGGSGGSTVSYSQTLSSGTEVGEITIDGVGTKMYAPTPPSTSNIVSEVSFDSANSKITRTKGGTTSDVVGTASSSTAGLMASADKSKLDGIAAGATANVGTVTSVATGAGLKGTVTSSGTIKADLLSETLSSRKSAQISSTANRQYAVNLDSDSHLSVNVPWEKTSVSVSQTQTSGTEVGEITVDNTTTKLYAPTPPSTSNIVSEVTFDSTNSKITRTKGGTTGDVVGAASQSSAGLMSSSDKTKLDGVATGATANTGTVTSVAAGAGLKGTVTSSGTIKADLLSETPSSRKSEQISTTANRQYAVNLDSDEHLSVNVPWEQTSVSVSQTLTSGTEIGEVTVDGVGTKLYAPSSQSTVEQLTLTRTNNSYVNATSFNRILAHRIGKLVIVRFNLNFSSNMPANTAATKIGQITLPGTAKNSYQTIPPQAGTGGVALVTISDDGSISIQNASNAALSGWYRAMIPLVLD